MVMMIVVMIRVTNLGRVWPKVTETELGLGRDRASGTVLGAKHYETFYRVYLD